MSPRNSSTFRSWYDKLAAFKVESLFARSKEPGPARSVFVHQDLPAAYKDKKGKVIKDHVYSTNQVITSKYTIITFLPRNLLEQFRRIANIFFAVIAILQFFPAFSTISPGLAILPLLIVLTVTAIKDGYEDIKRHQSDRRVNSTLIRILEGSSFVNPNVGQKKSRTFVRGFVRNSRMSKKVKTGDGDVERQMQQAPTVQGSEEVAPVDDGFEFDYALDERSYRDSMQPHHTFSRHHHPDQPHWKKGQWEDVKVGDFIKIMDGEGVPADIVICATSEDENVAYVETKNLDGETNLKSRNASPPLTYLRNAKDCADTSRPFRIDCDRPNINMYNLSATVKIKDEQAPIDIQETLLRGCVLRHTGWVIGIVLFTGEDTKIVLNSGITPSKRSRVERRMNPQVFANLTLLAVMAVVCGIVDSVLEQHYFPLDAPWLFGDSQSNDNPHINGLITWASALITFQNVVPISLYISIEVVRTLQSAFIYFDKEIWYEKTNQAAVARSWNLSDDLGQIEYIFSDKTGTLTQNIMVFRRCTIAGKAYKGDTQSEPESEMAEKPKDSGDTRPSTFNSDSDATPVPIDATPPVAPPKSVLRFHDAELSKDIEAAMPEYLNSEDSVRARLVNGFFTVLSLCHTVLTNIDPDTGVVLYKAQSPDEEALVRAAADVGYVFRGREKNILQLQTPYSEELETYQLLNILEFSSARKRMSVIVKKLYDEDGRIFLLSKGADNVIFERLKPGISEDLKVVTEKHLDEFASEGLRTLTLAYKVVSQEEYDAWNQNYCDATVTLEDREGKIEAVSNEIEQDLRLLGATAIEDRLQDGVPETIEDLKIAGIKIWVATGDKLETAIAIGHSTNLIASDSNMIIIRGGDNVRPVYEQMVDSMREFFPESDVLTKPEVLENVVEETPPPSDPTNGTFPLRRVNTGAISIVGSENGKRSGGFVLVVDGSALTQAFSKDAHSDFLLNLAMKCEAVVCCRVSPLQKAKIVKLVKDGLGVMTLAIGDGANDVSMIQAADIGVGIAGEEGLQAVNSSDYAIAQFRFLKRLLLVHGHWSYSRNGNMIVNFFYKNIVCIGVLWWFQIFCAWSSQYVIEYTYILFWNTFLTVGPVIAIGLFDRIADDDVLMAAPQLYRFGRTGHWYNTKLFVIFMLDGVYQSVVIYFIIQYAYTTTSARGDGFDVAQYEFSTVMVMAAILAANLFNGLNTNVWTAWVFFALALGIVLSWGYTAIYSLISPGWFSTPVFGNDHFLFLAPYFWFSIFLTVPLALAPRYLWKAYKFNFAPDDMDRARKREGFGPAPSKDHSGDTLLHLQPRGDSRPVSVSRRTTFEGETATSPNRNASRTDMSTGIRSAHRGFDFATEEGGPAMRRLQSNLSSVREADTGDAPRRKHSFSIASLKKSLGRRRRLISFSDKNNKL